MSDVRIGLRFDAYVAEKTDRLPLMAAGNQLANWLAAASGTKHAIEWEWRDSDTLDPPGPGAIASVMSLVGDVARDASLADIAARRRLQLGSLLPNGKQPFFSARSFVMCRA
jgi:hypothetical protein